MYYYSGDFEAIKKLKSGVYAQVIITSSRPHIKPVKVLWSNGKRKFKQKSNEHHLSTSLRKWRIKVSPQGLIWLQLLMRPSTSVAKPVWPFLLPGWLTMTDPFFSRHKPIEPHHIPGTKLVSKTSLSGSLTRCEHSAGEAGSLEHAALRLNRDYSGLGVHCAWLGGATAYEHPIKWYNVSRGPQWNWQTLQTNYLQLHR